MKMMAKAQRPAAISQEDLIDIDGAAKLIWVKRKTIENWLSLGKLKRFKAGRRTLLSRTQVLAQVREE